MSTLYYFCITYQGNLIITLRMTTHLCVERCSLHSLAISVNSWSHEKPVVQLLIGMFQHFQPHLVKGWGMFPSELICMITASLASSMVTGSFSRSAAVRGLNCLVPKFLTLPNTIVQGCVPNISWWVLVSENSQVTTDIMADNHLILQQSGYCLPHLIEGHWILLQQHVKMFHCN